MSMRFNTPVFRPQDNKGRTLPGAQLFFFENYSTTPKTTYANVALTNPNPHPIIADGAGKFTDIFLGIGDYRVILTDRKGQILWDRNDVSTNDLTEDVINDIERQLNEVLNQYRMQYLGEYGVADPDLEKTFTVPNAQYVEFNGLAYWTVPGTTLPYTTDSVTYPDPATDPNLTIAPNVTFAYVDTVTNLGDSQSAGGSIWPLSSQDSAQIGDTGLLNVLFLGDGDYYYQLDGYASGEIAALDFEAGTATIGGVDFTLKAKPYLEFLVSDISSLSLPVGIKIKPTGYFSNGDLNRHPGFTVKQGAPTPITGRIINLTNGNYAEIDCDDNSINVNWIGVNTDRTDAENSAQITGYLSEIPSGDWHTLFFNDNHSLGNTVITRDNVILKTNNRSKLLSSEEWIFRPDCNGFKMQGFYTESSNFRLVYLDQNASQVSNHDYEDIRVNGANPSTRTPFLYSTAQGGLGWANISYTNVRGFTAEGTATAQFINMDHGTPTGICSEVYLYKCRSQGYTELYESSGNGFCTRLEIRNSFAINSNGQGLITYHSRGGLVVESNEIRGSEDVPYIWAGVDVTNTARDGAIIINNKFTDGKSTATNQVTGLPIGHGVLYEQLQRATLSGNIYRNNPGGGFLVGAGCFIDAMKGETSTQNKWGCVLCSDGGGITERIRQVAFSDMNVWGNLEDAMLIGGRVERITIDGGNWKGNNTNNSGLNTGQACIRYDKNHTEVKVGGVQETLPQLNKLDIKGAQLGLPKIGVQDVQSYPEYSVSVDSDVSTNIIVTGGTELNSRTAEFNIVTPSGTRLYILGCVKESNPVVDLISSGSAGITNLVKDASYDWDGNAI